MVKTGKTEAAQRRAAKHGDALLHIDLSSYREKGAAGRLVGAPVGYVGADDKNGLFNQPVDKAPRGAGVVLLDEIEPPHRDLFDVLKRAPKSGRDPG